jgi:hemerythrin-like domain-containing protein
VRLGADVVDRARDLPTASTPARIAPSLTPETPMPSTSHRASQSATPSNRAASRAESSARSEIIGMLKDDHKRAKKAFRQFEKLDPHEDAEQCQAIVEQTCAELKLHTALEEELLYPAARKLLSEEDLIDEAEVEHATAKSLIEQLGSMTPDDEKYAATFKVLGEYVNHHVKEEENEIFPQLGRAKAEWQGLCDEMNSRRDELMQQLLPEAEAADGASASRRGSSTASRTASRASRTRGGEAEQRAQAASQGQSDDED